MEGEKIDREKTYKVTRMVEKPAPGTTDSDMAIIGRYILMPEIFDILDTITPGHGGEIQLTDALLGPDQKKRHVCLEFEGTRFDAGDKMGYLKAIIAYGLRHPALGKQLTKHLKEVVATL